MDELEENNVEDVSYTENNVNFNVEEDENEIRSIQPNVEVIENPKDSQNTVACTQITKSCEDSFDKPVEIIPASQEPIRNGIKVTPFSAFDTTTMVDLSKFHRYALKYLNCVGQVIAVIKTKRHSLFLRLWDGSSHQFRKTDHLLHIENTEIESYISEPKSSLDMLTSKHYIDIEIYGEYKETVEKLKSGDLVAIFNLHLYKLNNCLTPTLHEGGHKFNRQVYLLNDEEGDVIEMKRKLSNALERIKTNSNVNEVSRMDSFFKSSRPSAQIRPIQTNIENRQIIRISPDPPTPIRQIETTSPVVVTRVTSRLSPIREVIVEENCANESREGFQKKVVDELSLPSKKRKHTEVVSISDHASHTSKADFNEVRVVSRRSTGTIQQEPSSSRKQPPLDEDSISRNPPSEIKQARVKKSDIDKYFRERFPSPDRPVLEPIDEPIRPTISHSGSIFDFITRRKTTKETGAQISTSVSKFACQTSPEKKSKMMSVSVQTISMGVNQSVQTSPLKTPKKAANKQPESANEIEENKQSKRQKRASFRPPVPLHRSVPSDSSNRIPLSNRSKSMETAKKQSFKIKIKKEIKAEPNSENSSGSRKSSRLSGKPIPPPRIESHPENRSSPRKRQSGRTYSPDLPNSKKYKLEKKTIKAKEEHQESEQKQNFKLMRIRPSSKFEANQHSMETRSRGTSASSSGAKNSAPSPAKKYTEQKPVIRALVQPIRQPPISKLKNRRSTPYKPLQLP